MKQTIRSEIRQPHILFFIAFLLSFLLGCTPAARDLEEVKREELSQPEEILSDGSGSVGESQEEGYPQIRSLSDLGEEKWSEGTVRYQGKLYRYKDSMQNYLFMGIDNDGPARLSEDGISGGQSDAMFLLSMDERERELFVIAINRNTIVPVDVYNRDGEFISQVDLQICLQHGYGDGMKLSCIRSVEAVERLFRNIPISGYVALNMGGLAAMNDAAGGITLEPLESIRRGDVTIKKGEEITLTGEQAYAYLRTRDVEVFGSADERLKRQMQYILLFFEKLTQNTSLANTVYNAGADYIVASIDLPKLINSTRDMTFDEDHMYSVPGTTSEQNTYEWYTVDEKKFLDLIFEVFYEEVKES